MLPYRSMQFRRSTVFFIEFDPAHLVAVPTVNTKPDWVESLLVALTPTLSYTRAKSLFRILILLAHLPSENG